MSRQKATQTALQNLTDVGRAAERTAVTGWQEVAEAFETAANRTQDLAGDARSRAADLRKQANKRGKDARKRGEQARKRGLAAKDEAYRRGSAARDALGGKQTHTWRWIVVAAAAGIGAGAAVVGFGRKLIQSREQAQLEKIEQTVAESAGDTSIETHVNGYPVATGSAAVNGTSAGVDTGTTPAPRSDSPKTGTPTVE